MTRALHARAATELHSLADAPLGEGSERADNKLDNSDRDQRAPEGRSALYTLSGARRLGKSKRNCQTFNIAWFLLARKAKRREMLAEPSKFNSERSCLGTPGSGQTQRPETYIGAAQPGKNRKS